MWQFPEIAHIFQNYLDMEAESGPTALDELKQLATSTPAHYIGPVDMREEVDAYMTAAMARDYNAPHALDEEVADVVTNTEPTLGKRKRTQTLGEGGSGGGGGGDGGSGGEQQPMQVDHDSSNNDGYVHFGQNPNHPDGLWSQPPIDD